LTNLLIFWGPLDLGHYMRAPSAARGKRATALTLKRGQ